MVYYLYDPFTENHTFLVNNLILNLDLYNYKYEEIRHIDNKDDDDIYIIIINHMFFIKDNNAKIDYENLISKKKKILYITEPLELIIEIKYYNNIINKLKPIKIFTYCEENLKKINPICSYDTFFPINKKYLKFVESNISLINKKDLSKIVFIGKMNEYRSKIKDIFKNDLIIIEDKYKKEEWIEIIKKYQYFINIHRRPNSLCFESMRIIPLLYNNCTVISEYVNEKEINFFQKGNIYFCKMEEMKNKFEEIKKIKINKIFDNHDKIDYTKYYQMKKLFI